MALVISTEYTEAIAPSAEYPQGSFKDVSTPAGVDGTPFDKEWPDDIYGLLQRLLLDAGITPSGNADTVLNSDYFNALSALFSPKSSILINGGFTIAQRGTSFTSATTPANDDDAYLLDRGILLSDGADIVDVTQSTAAPAGSLNSWQFDVETINKKFGYLQIVEQKNCIDIIGGVASLSFKAKVSDITKLDNIKAAIVSWDGAADAVTSDIVSTWNSEDTTPTLVANWTFENTPVNLGVTAAWAEYKIENIDIDTASTKNVALFIWSDGFCDTLGTLFNITDLNFIKGSAAAQYRPRHNELSLCESYLRKWGNASLVEILGSGQSRSTTVVYFSLTFEKMREAPTITVDAGTAFEIILAGIGTQSDCTFTGTADITAKGVRIDFSGTFTNALAGILRAKVDKYIFADAEL